MILLRNLILTIISVILFVYGNGCKNPTEPSQEKPADSTSHNFSFQKFEFGDLYGTGMHSSIHDVAIINENDIWAVGEIYIKDSTGKSDFSFYNAIHWDGRKWELISIPYKDKYNFISMNPITSIIAFDSQNIWFSNCTYWDGRKFNSITLDISFPVRISKIWGTSNKDIYFIGTGGNIAHYDGSRWKKVESGTTMDLLDICSKDGQDIYVSGGNYQNYDGILLKGNANGFIIIAEGRGTVTNDSLFKPYFAGVGNFLWLSPSGTLYFGGSLLQTYKEGQLDLVKSLDGNYLGIPNHGDYWGYLSKISGNTDNDMVLVGESNTLRHYNGVSWKQLGLPYDYKSNLDWYEVAMKGNVISAVGSNGSNGVVMLLKRG